MKTCVLTFALSLLCCAMPAPSTAQPKSVSVQVADTSNGIAEEVAKRREAEFDKAIAEAKIEVIEAGNGRLETLIGIFGLLITVGLGVAAFFTWKAAANAARSEVQDIRDKVETLANQAEAHTANIVGHLDTAAAGVAKIGALSDDAQLTIASMTNAASPKATQEIRDEIENLASAAANKPEGKRTLEELLALIYSARSQPDWAEMIELSEELRLVPGASIEVKSDADFHRSTALHFLGNFEEAAASWERYIEDFPELESSKVASALYHWGNSLARLGSGPINRIHSACGM